MARWPGAVPARLRTDGNLLNREEYLQRIAHVSSGPEASSAR